MSLWLPPLNSHEDYFMRVDATDDIQISPSELLQFTNIQRPIFVIKLWVSAVYRIPNPNQDQIIDVPYLFIPIPRIRKTLEIDRNPKTLLTSLTDEVLNANLVPIQLHHCYCTWDAENITTESDNLDEEEVYIKVFEYLCKLTKSPNNAKCKILPVLLIIHKVLDIPHDEFFSWVSYFTEKKLIRPSERLNIPFVFLDNAGIGGPRSETDVFEEKLLLMMYKPASNASVNELESVIYDDDKDYNSGYAKSCSICFEEFINGISRVTRLPCLHVFHGCCVVRWLRVNHVCPLCSYHLPTSEDEEEEED